MYAAPSGAPVLCLPPSPPVLLVHPAFVFPPPPALSEDYIAEHTKIAGKSGHLYLLPGLATMHPVPGQDPTLWE